MRVLLITSVYARHEADDQVPWLRECCRRVRDKGVELEILAPSFKGLKTHTIDGITVHRFRYAPAGWETLTGEEGSLSKIRRRKFQFLLGGMYLWCGFWALAGLLCQKKYNVVEVHWPFPHALMALPALFAGIPLIYHYHSAERKLAARNFLYAFLFWWSLGWAKAHVANSSYTAGLIKMIRPKTKVELIAYGSPLKMVEPAVGIAPRRKILFVGRHIERKGLAYLLDAMKFLPSDYSLTVVGDGDLTESLKQKAAGDKRISFPGRLANEALAKAYLEHDMFVLPAIVDGKGDTEGLGVVLIEAISAGLPIVASNVGGIPDVVKEGKTGLLVPEKDPLALAQAIERLGNDVKLSERLVGEARLLAERQFSWEAVVKGTVEIYQKCI